jgi:hypothetical protein
MKTQTETDQTTHTPGPWAFDYDQNYNRFNLRGKTSFGHFQGWSSDGVTTEAEDKANARLIAAAPDLLAALEHIVSTQIATENFLKCARAAIAKAKPTT